MKYSKHLTFFFLALTLSLKTLGSDHLDTLAAKLRKVRFERERQCQIPNSSESKECHRLSPQRNKTKRSSYSNPQGSLERLSENFDQSLILAREKAKRYDEVSRSYQQLVSKNSDQISKLRKEQWQLIVKGSSEDETKIQELERQIETLKQKRIELTAASDLDLEKIKERKITKVTSHQNLFI